MFFPKAAIKGFNTQTSSKVANLKDEKVYQGLISDVSYSYWSESPMVESYQIIRNLDETSLGTFCDAIPGVSAWSFIYKLDSMIRNLLRRAIYTCHQFCADMEPAAALAKTLVIHTNVLWCRCRRSKSTRFFPSPRCAFSP